MSVMQIVLKNSPYSKIKSNFNELAAFQKAHLLCEVFGEIINKAEIIRYNEATKQQKQEVKDTLFTELNSINAEIEDKVIYSIEWKALKEMLTEYIQDNGTLKPIAAKLIQYREKKITVISFTEFGFPAVIQGTLNNVEVKGFSSYTEALYITYNPRRKPVIEQTVITPNESFIIYDGWRYVNAEMMLNVDRRTLETSEEFKYNSFDNQFLLDTLNSIAAEPIIKIING